MINFELPKQNFTINYGDFFETMIQKLDILEKRLQIFEKKFNR